MNDELQEAKEDNEQTKEAGAMTIISMMIDDCPLEMIYDSLFGSRAVSIAFNYKEASKTVTLKEVNGSIIECSGEPY